MSRIERSTAEAKGNVVFTCRLREGNFEKSPLAEFGCDARSFTGDREGCWAGGTRRGRAVSGDRVALGTRSCFWSIRSIITGMFSEMHLDITTTTNTTTYRGALYNKERKTSAVRSRISSKLNFASCAGYFDGAYFGFYVTSSSPY